MKDTMKAAIVHAPGDFNVQEVAVPQCPADGILLKVLACGLCGSDLRTLRNGHHRVELPFIIGHEICAEIKITGKEYTGSWKPGDRLAVSPLVFCGKCEFCIEGKEELCIDYKEIGQKWQGGFAEYMAIPGEVIERGTIQKVPEGLNHESVTIVEPLSSCVNAQEKGWIGSGDTVLIIGAGPIGTLHLELARSRSADRIIVADISGERLKLVESYSPDHIIDSSKEDLKEKVLKLTGGYGPEVIITANPAPETQVEAVEIARKGGRILLFGGLPKERSRPGVDMNLVHYNALHLIGTTIFAHRHNQEALELIDRGKISSSNFVSHTFSLEDFVKGAKLALEGKARKVVFIP